MRAVVQRVTEAFVEVEGEEVGRIGLGLLVLLGVGQKDTVEDAHYLARKIVSLRIFQDEAGKMNRSLKEVGGEVLLVSQFTLYAATRKGNRPSFIKAAPPRCGEKALRGRHRGRPPAGGPRGNRGLRGPHAGPPGERRPRHPPFGLGGAP